MVLEQARRIAGIKRTARRRDALLLSGQLSAGEIGSLPNRFFPLATFGIYNGFVGHFAPKMTERKDNGEMGN